MSFRGKLRLLAVVVAAALFPALGAAPAQALIEIKDLSAIPEERPRDVFKQGQVPASTVDPLDDSSATIPDLYDAGAHAALNFDITFCLPETPESQCRDPDFGGQTEDVKDLIIRLPPGMIGDPTAIPRCAWIDFVDDFCPSGAEIGKIIVDTVVDTGARGPAFGSLYNLQPGPSEVALLGTQLRVDKIVPGATSYHLPILIGVRTTSDFAIESRTLNSPRTLNIPKSPQEPITVKDIRVALFGRAGSPAKPFLTNPTHCTPGQFTVEANSWQDPTFTTASVPIQATNCSAVPFTPTIDITPDTTQAGAPSGYTVAIDFPYSESADIYQSQLKGATVTLPAGVAISPAGGADLAGCTEAQFGLGSDDAAQCPEGSKIADVAVETPVLDQNLTGEAYLARPSVPGGPTDANPWKLFMQVTGSGLNVKLSGDVTIDPATGQIKTTFTDLPKVPFTKFELKLRGGDSAVLANPTTCTPAKGEVDLEGWNGKSVRLVPEIIPTGCTSPQPFQPTVDEMSATPTQAGALSTSRIVLSRPDGHQLLERLDLSLPAGAVGSLAAVPACEAARIQAGSCPEDSRIGQLKVAAGAGGAPLEVPGSIYLGQPLVAGDAASIGIVVPARVGPIDLGRVVVTNRVKLRPTDAGVDVVSGDIPTMLEGIPLPVRRIEITVDREGFFRNPTGCDPRALVATFTSDRGSRASASRTTQATGCQSLAFRPKLRLIAGGSKALTRGSKPPLSQVHPNLRAIVTQEEGEANIASSKVVLPWILRPDLPRLQQPGALCQEAQLAVRACPANSRVGTATATTPLLASPLSGPVYIVQQFEAQNPLPRLSVFLDGAVSIRLDSQNRFVGGSDPRERIRTTNTFGSVPDVPITRFELTVDGGPNGLLNNWRDLCENPDTFDGTFNSHSGRSAGFKLPLEVEGCDEVPVSGLVSISGRAVRVDRRGRVPVRLRCRSEARCKGRLTLRTRGKVRVARRRARRRKVTLGRRSFSIPAGRRRTIRVRLTRLGRRALRRNRRIRVKVTAKLGSKTARRTIRVRAAKKKRARRRR